MKKQLIWGLGIAALVIVIALIAIGCGSGGIGGGNNASTGNYTLSGRIGTVVGVTGLKALSVTAEVTHIVAVGADNSKTVATPEAGVFSLSLDSGQPYVLGFFNKSNGVITLLGYLQTSSYDWDSLPLVDPADTATDLGTIEIDAASVEATPSVDITTLIGEMNLTSSEADLYGAIDDSLTALINLDIDANGTFDFDENKSYLFQTFIGMFDADNPSAGEIPSMLDGYNDTYKPVPSFYQIYFSCLGSGDLHTNGATATLLAPSALGGSLTQTATVSASSSGWTIFFLPSVSTPSVAPAGTYLATIEGDTYTIKNFESSNIVAIGSNNNIVYPVFHLVTNEAGKITTVQYLWKKLVNGTVASASAAEVLAAINYDADGNSFTQNPFISFFQDANNLFPVGGSGLVSLPIDQSEVDVSGLNKTPAQLNHIQAGYELTSKVICKFDLWP